MSGPFHYLAYGCQIHSDLELAELHPSVPGNDIRVRVVSALPDHDLPPGSSSAPYDVRVSEEEAYLSLPGQACYFAANGTEILVELESEADLRAVQLNVVTAMLPLLLMQRGLLLLHGSAVSFNGVSYAFLGPSGAGKSSTAASLCSAGAHLLVDDVVAVDLSGDRPMVCPGFPHLKLHAAVSDQISVQGGVRREIHPLEEKRGLALQERFLIEKQALGGVFFLNLGDNIGIRELSAPEMMRALSCNPYINGLAPSVGRFQDCANLASRVRGYELIRSASVADLPQFTEMLLSHIHGTNGSLSA